MQQKKVIGLRRNEHLLSSYLNEQIENLHMNHTEDNL